MTITVSINGDSLPSESGGQEAQVKRDRPLIWVLVG